MNKRPPLCVTISLDVEEEGLFSGRYACDNPSIKNTSHLIRLLPLLDRGVKPTLFCAYSAFADVETRKTLEKLRNYGDIEIGAHLHHWNTPPMDMKQHPGHAQFLDSVPTKKVPLEFMAAKLKNLFQIANDFQGSPVTSFRMGRWDIHREHWPLLRDNGVLCDASVRPLHDFVSKNIGPDHFDAPVLPYWINLGHEKILEIPLTVTPVLPVFKKLSDENHLGEILRPGLKKWGALTLLPIEHPLALMCLTTMIHVKNGGQFLSLTWHSSEMMPGGAPHMPSEKAVSRFLIKINKYLDWLENNYAVTYSTMTEIRQNYKAFPQPQGKINCDWTWDAGFANV